MQHHPQQQQQQAMPPQGDPNAQQINGPQPGDITGDPTLDQALADIMTALPRGGDQVMSNLLAALQPYLIQPGTGMAQGNPIQGA